jgi:hypothetical protein
MMELTPTKRYLVCTELREELGVACVDAAIVSPFTRCRPIDFGLSQMNDIWEHESNPKAKFTPAKSRRQCFSSPDAEREKIYLGAPQSLPTGDFVSFGSTRWLCYRRYFVRFLGLNV